MLPSRYHRGANGHTVDGKEVVDMDALTVIHVVFGLVVVAGIVVWAFRNSRHHSPSVTLKGGPGVGGQSDYGPGGGVPMPGNPQPSRSRRRDQP